MLRMPPDHLKPYHFKKGQSGNPGGQPKLSEELKSVVPLTPKEVTRTISKYCRMDVPNTQEAAISLNLPIYEVTIAKALLVGAKTGDISKLAYLFDRAIGKIKSDVEFILSDSKEELDRESIRKMPMAELVDKVKDYLAKEQEANAEMVVQDPSRGER